MECRVCQSPTIKYADRYIITKQQINYTTSHVVFYHVLNVTSISEFFLQFTVWHKLSLHSSNTIR